VHVDFLVVLKKNVRLIRLFSGHSFSELRGEKKSEQSWKRYIQACIYLRLPPDECVFGARYGWSLPQRNASLEYSPSLLGVWFPPSDLAFRGASELFVSLV